MNARPRLLPCLLVLPLLTACANTGSTGTNSKLLLADGMPQTRNDRIGVEMLTWHLRDSNTLDSVLAKRTKNALSGIPTDQLASSALTMTRIDESDLAVLLGELGGTSATMSAWCGQATDWRDVRDVHVSQAVIDINKSSILLDGGRLAIAARAWIEPTIDAARMRVEIVPRYTTDRPPKPSVRRTVRPKVHTFEKLAASTDLAPGEVLLLTCTAPPMSTPEEEPTDMVPSDGDETLDEFDPDDDPSLDSPAPGTRARAARSINLGHALFSVPLSIPNEPPERIIIVIVPRIPSTLMPGSLPVVPAPDVQTAEADR